jgi:hypothetical protein
MRPYYEKRCISSQNSLLFLQGGSFRYASWQVIIKTTGVSMRLIRRCKMKNIFFLLFTFAALITFSCKDKNTVTGPGSDQVIAIACNTIDISHNGTMGYTFGLKGVDQVKRFQTFIADSALPNLSGIDVKIRKNDSTAVYNNITVELYETSANIPTNLLAVSSISIDSLGGYFTVKSAPLSYNGLIAGNKYAIVLGQSNVSGTNNAGYEWCTKTFDSTLHFGKYSGTSWTDESILGDGWLKVYVNDAVSSNAYAFPAGTSVVFFDDFQRSNRLGTNGWADLATGIPDTVNFDIVDNGSGAKSARIKAAIILANGDTNWTDYTIYAKVKVTTLNTVLSLRFRATSTKMYEVEIYNGTTLLLGKYEGGWGTMNSATVSYTANTFSI